MPSELPPEEMLQNLSGFFEGDGCVQSNLLELTMIRSFQGAEVLFPFQRYFGGSVGVNTAETGTESAVLQWSVSGARARRAAELLSRAKLRKQRQLLLFARGLPRDTEERTAVVAQL